MAFNFNWSPLTADASFYERTQELLTVALNKYPKPPIIVDDILVNELNLGSVPPELEILEIGDLAEDRFRGIFKMSYSGDAFLTLKTKVQANPLNTYLSAKPSFASPQPLAASSGLTIPLQITLSSIRLSAFIILVFSKQKGVTLVFRNDPLESLKVSSTFDSIPFVRDYLQKEIEGQLRTLLMEELPAIIHRLSLRLFVPEYRERIDDDATNQDQRGTNEATVDPFSSPPQNPLWAHEDYFDRSGIPSMSLDPQSPGHAPTFSHKNLIRLTALQECQRTLSLFTPSIQDAVFRARTGSNDRGEVPGTNTPATPGLFRTHSSLGSISALYGNGQTDGTVQHSNRSSMYGGSFTGLTTHSNRSQPIRRKRKHRVVNLRKTETFSDTESISGESTTTATTTTAPTSESAAAGKMQEDICDEIVTPPSSPQATLSRSPGGQSVDPRSPTILRTEHPARVEEGNIFSPATQADSAPKGKLPQISKTQNTLCDETLFETSGFAKNQHKSYTREDKKGIYHLVTEPSWHNLRASVSVPPPNAVDPDWIMRMASEIARTSRETKHANDDSWNSEDLQDAPPAYGA